MKNVYPVILTPTDNGYFVTIPDLDINTQGSTLAEAMEMSRDAIGLWGITQEDLGNAIPAPSQITPPQMSHALSSFSSTHTLSSAPQRSQK